VAGLHRKWWTLIVACAAIFMLLLDVSVVNVALPDIREDLGSSFIDLQWVIDAYALTLAALLLTAGSLADRLGRKRVFLFGVGLFTLASLLCGLAPDPLALNLARGLQGVGGAVMWATSLALIAQEFEGRERGTAFGIWGATTGVALALGPLVGGALTDSLGWEWIFFVNVPLGLIAYAITAAQVTESRDPEARGVDWAGLVTFSSAIFLLIFALIRGNEEGWTSPLIVGLFAGSVALLGLFVLAELRQARPMLDLTLFRKPAFAGVSVVAFTLTASSVAMLLYLALYFQNVLGFSPLETGVRVLPMTLLAFAVAPIAGKLSAVLPVRALMGLGLACAGLGLALMHGVTATSEWTAVLGGLLFVGAAIGIINPVLVSAAVGVVPAARSGMASGINNTFRQLGLATGIAGFGAIFQTRITDMLDGALTSAHTAGGPSGTDLARWAATGQAKEVAAAVPPGARPRLAEAVPEAFVSGLNQVFLVGSTLAFAGAVLAVLLIRRRDFADAEPVGGAVPAPA
jgi:EmrB/QacA subfamily drug resistance transporter